jgi:hypothetical protein
MFRRTLGVLCLAALAVAAQPAPGAAAEQSAPRNYVLGPEDQITIRVLEAEDIDNKPVRVDFSGYIRLPLVGRIQAGGKTSPESAGPGGAPGSSEQGNFALARAIVEHWTSHARQAMVVRFLVPLCPSESLTSVAAIHCLVASCPEKGQARPRWRDCEVIANRAEPGKFKSKESMPWRNAKSPPSSGCRTGG